MNNEQILIKAIKERKFIDFYYEDKPIRKVAPHAIYRSSTGKENLDAYQYDGYSEKGNLPAWRIFTLNKMDRISVLDENFQERDDYKTNSDRYRDYIYKI